MSRALWLLLGTWLLLSANFANAQPSIANEPRAQVLSGLRLTPNLSYDSDAQAYFGAMSTQPSNTQKARIDTLVRCLKTPGIWELTYALHLLKSHDQQSALLNLRSPGVYGATAQMSPGFAANAGFSTNGTSYIDTGIQAGVTGSQSSLTFGVWITDSGQFAGSVAGTYVNTTSGNTTIIPRNANDATSVRANSGATINTANGATASAAGFTVAERTGNTVEAWRNGVLVASASEQQRAPNALNFYLGGYNQGNALASSQTATFWLDYVGASLSAAQQLALYNCLNAYVSSF